MSRWKAPYSAAMVVLLGGAGFAALRSGWLPVEFGGAPTGSLVDVNSPTADGDQAPEFAAEETPHLKMSDRTSDSRDVSNERSLIEEPLESPDISQPAARRSKWDALLDEESPPEPGRIRSAVFQESSGRPSNGLRLVAEDQPTPPAKQPESTTDRPTLEAETPAAPAVRVAQRSPEQDAKFDFNEVDRQIKAGQVVEAHKALSKIYWQQPELRSRVQERIDLTARAIYFSPQPHIQEPHVVQAGDQLRKIASGHHVPWQYLARLNRTDPKRLREGQKLKVIDGPFGAIITLSDFELTLHLRGQYVRSYPCCIGKNNSTPRGKFKVLNKVTSPQYTDPDGKVFSGTDPKNPLGSHWIDLGDSYGIHGTIDPNSIGMAESRGCVRLLNTDVAEVFELLDTGAEVVIRP